MIDTFWGHQVISNIAYETFHDKCNDVSDDDSGRASSPAKKKEKKDCKAAISTLLKEMGSLNPYALDFRICTREKQLRSIAATQRSFLLRSLLERHDDENTNSQQLSRRLNIEEYVPCTPDYANAYLNLAAVKSAIHVKSAIQWSECSDPIWNAYNATDSNRVSTAPIYNFLIETNPSLKILVYSGDDDAVCGTVGTQQWIWNLGYPNTRKMWAEYLYNGQLAGYQTTWENTNLTFLTIHNAGHEVIIITCRFYSS